jgi:hypothetical protein
MNFTLIAIENDLLENRQYEDLIGGFVSKNAIILLLLIITRRRRASNRMRLFGIFFKNFFLKKKFHPISLIVFIIDF